MANIIERGHQKKVAAPQPGRKLVCYDCETLFELEASDKISEAYHPFGDTLPYHFSVRCPLCQAPVDFWGLSIDHGVVLVHERVQKDTANKYDFKILREDHEALGKWVLFNWFITLVTAAGIGILAGQVF